MKKVTTLLMILMLTMALVTFACTVDSTEAVTPDFGFTPVAAITVICYLFAEVIKATALDNKWLPIICMVLGGGLGVLAMYIMPDYPAKDILTAVAIGIVSGLAAVGVNQIYKQMTANKNT